MGFDRAGGYSCILAVDHDTDSTETFSLNFPGAQVVTADVRRVDLGDIRADVIVAGPPCQGFSTLNRSRANDARNALVFEVVRACDQTGARAVVVENVPPFLEAPEGRRLLTQLRQRGFGTRSGVVNAADYGVAQRRLRALVVGLRGGAAVWPRASHSDDPASGLPRHRTVADALALLPPTPDGRNWHRPYDLTNAMAERYRAVPEGGSRRDLPADLTLDCWVDTRGYTDVLGRLHWRRPATTVRTEFQRPEKGRFLHPTEHRPLTAREAARLQSFPDSFAFPETQTLTSVARQIGNAIPPRLAQAIAQELASALRTRDRRFMSMSR